MGLTIHWDLEFKGTNQEVLEKLKALRKVAKELPFQRIEGPEELNYANFVAAREKGERYKGWKHWACIQGNFYDTKIEKAFCLHLYPGIGCEPMNIGLRRLDNSLNWSWASFCKTQYAEEFAKCHLLVIQILDECKRLGILKRVNDEGDYWKTRDIKVLGISINESTEMLQGLSKKLSKTEFQVKAPITERANKMTELEMEFAKKNKKILPTSGNN